MGIKIGWFFNKLIEAWGRSHLLDFSTFCSGVTISPAKFGEEIFVHVSGDVEVDRYYERLFKR